MKLFRCTESNLCQISNSKMCEHWNFFPELKDEFSDVIQWLRQRALFIFVNNIIVPVSDHIYEAQCFDMYLTTVGFKLYFSYCFSVSQFRNIICDIKNSRSKTIISRVLYVFVFVSQLRNIFITSTFLVLLLTVRGLGFIYFFVGVSQRELFFIFEWISCRHYQVGWWFWQEGFSLFKYDHIISSQIYALLW